MANTFARTLAMAVLAVCGFVFLAGQCRGATYWVAPGGLAANDGTEKSPWPDVNTAIAKAGPGHTFKLKEGVYPAFEIKVSAKPGEHTVIEAAEKWHAAISTADVDSIVIGGQGVILKGLNVTGATSAAISVEADNVSIEQCMCHHVTTAISAMNRSWVRMDHNWIEQNSDGIRASGDHITVINNVIWDNSRYGVNLGPAVTKSQVHSNILGFNKGGSIRLGAGQDNRVVQNTLYQCPVGIDLGLTRTGRIANNLAANCQTPITPAKPDSGNEVHHNVVETDLGKLGGSGARLTEPLYVKQGDAPIIPIEGCVAIGAGDPSMCPLFDLLGHRTGSRVDCGAIQHESGGHRHFPPGAADAGPRGDQG